MSKANNTPMQIYAWDYGEGQRVARRRWASKTDEDAAVRHVGGIAPRGVLYMRGDAAFALLAACKEFVRKVDAGEARSVRSYTQMKAAIGRFEREAA